MLLTSHSILQCFNAHQYTTQKTNIELTLKALNDYVDGLFILILLVVWPPAMTFGQVMAPPLFIYMLCGYAAPSNRVDHTLTNQHSFSLSHSSI
jgi:hypothetical protein